VSGGRSPRGAGERVGGGGAWGGRGRADSSAVQSGVGVGHLEYSCCGAASVSRGGPRVPADRCIVRVRSRCLGSLHCGGAPYWFSRKAGAGKSWRIKTNAPVGAECGGASWVTALLGGARLEKREECEGGEGGASYVVAGRGGGGPNPRR